MSRATDELKKTLNETVTESDGVDVVFAFDLSTGFVIDSSISPKVDKALLNDSAMASFSSLKNVKGAVNDFAEATKRGNLEYTIFHLSAGVLIVYFEDIREQPMAIGFVSTLSQGQALGKVLYFCRKYIPAIKEKLRQALL